MTELSINTLRRMLMRRMKPKKSGPLFLKKGKHHRPFYSSPCRTCALVNPYCKPTLMDNIYSVGVRSYYCGVGSLKDFLIKIKLDGVLRFTEKN